MPSVLVTGANRGLGLEFAAQYLAANWHVYAACRDPSAADQLQLLGRRQTERLDILAMDVTSAPTIAQAAARIGDRPIDVLINGAGIIGKPDQRTGKVDYTSWREVLDVNTMGPLRVTEAFTDHVARSDRKLVVTITSGMGSLADNTSGGYIAYRSSKAAVNMVMRSAAIDLAPRGISCVVVNPGWVRTDMGGANATLSPEQSVTAIRRLIETLGAAQSGKFFNYDGREYPW
ncbi:MAG TPA: SDR family oxidoreductase [Steroidobacteraceae bacterium]|nr:SDR family oxidoreductase [Steroidobacteraceae bacterium]